MKVFISPVHYFMDRKFYGSEVEESFFFYYSSVPKLYGLWQWDKAKARHPLATNHVLNMFMCCETLNPEWLFLMAEKN